MLLPLKQLAVMAPDLALTKIAQQLRLLRFLIALAILRPTTAPRSSANYRQASCCAF